MAKNNTADKATADDDGLVALGKDGEVIRAHPRQCALWIKQGWTTVVEPE